MAKELQNELNDLVWLGTLNIEVSLHKSLVVAGTPADSSVCHLRIPRESYLVLYLPLILLKFKDILRFEIINKFHGWWFEVENKPVYWNHPVGPLYDSLRWLNPNDKTREFDEDLIVMWKLTLNYSETLPVGMIPLINELNQVEDSWRHEWKQACFIMNGSSKQIMSLSIPDSKLFWHSVLIRDTKNFRNIASKIVPRKGNMRAVPIRIHLTTLNGVEVIQPNSKILRESSATLGSLLRIELPQLFDLGAINADPIIQGIEVSLESQLISLYNGFASIDGFLHVSIRMI
ncbi:Atg5p Ecym_2407 [Eremothecium cymbalariae DBVPG|uniref:Autophagy protein 5 n=1 Tax=Eremothecium cymbalariae (strain CBS 270.75 / DBVPG 7215 / KCTC 17166 / NRRL Y-17582) TaxID=931890 RepID=G8JP82_ERECY|nr:Hypothetical protein Ecym_2407 [Eremothecium cymbalariae DBVPG\